MILKLNLHNLLLANFLTGFGYCYSILYHPDLVKYYLKTRSNLPDTTCNKSNNCILGPNNKAEIFDQCLKIAETSIYRLVESNERMHESAVEPPDIITRDDIVKYFSNQGDTLIVINLKAPAIEKDVKVFQCVEKKDKIVYIENVNLYNIFIFERNKTDNDVKIKMAIYDDRPQMRWCIKKYLQEVQKYRSAKGRTCVAYMKQLGANEEQFVKSVVINGEIHQENDICEVKNFDLVYLCASVYHIFKSSGKTRRHSPLLHEIRRPADEIMCKPLPITLLVTKYGPIIYRGGKKSITVNAVPCAINSKWEEPNFYILAGNGSNNPVLYFIEQFGRNYHVTMKTKQVKALNEVLQREQSD